MTTWLAHVKKTRTDNPGVQFKQVLKLASKTWTKKSEVKPKKVKRAKQISGDGLLNSAGSLLKWYLGKMSGLSLKSTLTKLSNDDVQAFLSTKLGASNFRKLVKAFVYTRSLPLAGGSLITRIRKMANRNPKSKDPFTGEHHAIQLSGRYIGSSYNFLGPGTALVKRLNRGDRGINAADEGGRMHDIAYHKMHGLTGDALKQGVIAADIKLIKKLLSNFNLLEARIAAVAMASKLIAQYTGLVKWNKFVNHID